MRMEKSNHLKMYLLLKNGDFPLVILVFGGKNRGPRFSKRSTDVCSPRSHHSPGCSWPSRKAKADVLAREKRRFAKTETFEEKEERKKNNMYIYIYTYIHIYIYILWGSSFRNVVKQNREKIYTWIFHTNFTHLEDPGIYIFTYIHSLRFILQIFLFLSKTERKHTQTMSTRPVRSMTSSLPQPPSRLQEESHRNWLSQEVGKW